MVSNDRNMWHVLQRIITFVAVDGIRFKFSKWCSTTGWIKNLPLRTAKFCV